MGVAAAVCSRLSATEAAPIVPSELVAPVEVKAETCENACLSCADAPLHTTADVFARLCVQALKISGDSAK